MSVLSLLSSVYADVFELIGVGHSYSPDHRYFAIVERHSGKDCIGVYDTSDQFQLVRVSPSYHLLISFDELALSSTSHRCSDYKMESLWSIYRGGRHSYLGTSLHFGRP